MPPGTHENIELVRSAYAIGLDWTDPESGRPTVDALLDLLDPKVVFVSDAGQPGRIAYAGTGEFRHLLEQSSEEWERCRYEIGELVAADEERVLATGRVVARKRCGTRVEVPFANVWTVRGGRAVRIESYADRGAALEAIGRDSPSVGE
jgi:ketosteroid isomerase-like protein